LFALLVLVETGVLFGQNDTWTNLGPGGTITALAIDPVNRNTLYAGAKGGKVYKSTDGGKTWTGTALMSSDNVSVLVIDPQNPSTIYAGSDMAYGGVGTAGKTGHW
jgi:hypothetical protein